MNSRMRRVVSSSRSMPLGSKYTIFVSSVKFREVSRMEWAALRKRARQLERDAENTLANYLALCSSLRVDVPQPTDEEAPGIFTQEEEMHATLYGMIAELQGLGQRMLACSEAQTPANAVVARRSVALAVEYKADADKASASFRRAKDSYDLFHGARRRHGQAGASATESLLTERESLHSSLRMTDEMLDHAHETRSMLRAQTRILQATSSALNTIEQRFPASRKLIHAIRHNRQRDNIIIAVVTGLCICLILLYLLP